MQSFGFEAMVNDVPAFSGRYQPLRRPSAGSNSTVSSSKRGSKGIIKANSGGNSPLGIQRRRTTASHPIRSYYSTAQDHAQNYSQRKAGLQHRSMGPVMPVRPMSWHPGSRNHSASSEALPSNESTIRSTIAGFQNLAVANESLPQQASAFNTPLCVNPLYPSDALAANLVNPSLHNTSLHNNYTSYNAAGSGASYQSYHSFQPSHQTMNAEIPPSYYYSYDSSLDLREPGWSQGSSDFGTVVQPPTPDFLPIQYPVDPPPELEHASPISKKRSKELIGMGLYDDPDRDIHTNLDITDTSALKQFASPYQVSMGKGLKLEETWQPPNSQEETEDDGEEEETCSTDEAEEDPPIVATVPEDPQTAFYPAYSDLSNQSFFFDADDHYTGCFAFGQGVQVCQPKVPVSTSENFFWF